MRSLDRIHEAGTLMSNAAAEIAVNIGGAIFAGLVAYGILRVGLLFLFSRDRRD